MKTSEFIKAYEAYMAAWAQGVAERVTADKPLTWAPPARHVNVGKKTKMCATAYWLREAGLEMAGLNQWRRVTVAV